MLTDEHCRIIYEETLSTLEEQMRAVDGARQAAGRALGLASIVLGVSTGLGTHAPHAAAVYTAAGLLLLALGVLVAVWWPRYWRFGIDAKKAIEVYVEHPKVDGKEVDSLTLGELYLKRAKHLQEDINHNKPRLELLQIGVQVVLVLTVLVILAVVLGSLGVSTSQGEAGAGALGGVGL